MKWRRRRMLNVGGSLTTTPKRETTSLSRVNCISKQIVLFPDAIKKSIDQKADLPKELMFIMGEKEKYDMEVINESKAINLLRKEEQKAQLKVEEMLNALGEATKMYKDNEKRVLQQQRMKEESMKLQHEAADTINCLKADLNQLFMSGDKFHEEEKQLTHDIANLKTLLKKEREEKDNMKKKLETVQNERKLAEAKVLDQQNTLTVLRKHYEMLQSDLNGRF